MSKKRISLDLVQFIIKDIQIVLLERGMQFLSWSTSLNSGNSIGINKTRRFFDDRQSSSSNTFFGFVVRGSLSAESSVQRSVVATIVSNESIICNKNYFKKMFHFEPEPRSLSSIIIMLGCCVNTLLVWHVNEYPVSSRINNLSDSLSTNE